MYYKIPNNITKNIIIYDTQLNLTQCYDYENYNDTEYKRNIKIYTEQINNDIYIIFAFDDIQVIGLGITECDYSFFYNMPNEFFIENFD